MRSKRKEAAEALESIFSELDNAHSGSIPKESIVKAATLGKFNGLSSKYKEYRPLTDLKTYQSHFMQMKSSTNPQKLLKRT